MARLARPWATDGAARPARRPGRGPGRAPPRRGTTSSTRPIASASSARDLATGEDEVLGPRRADEPGQPLRAAAAGDDAEQDLGLAEPGLARSRCGSRRPAPARSRRRARSRRSPRSSPAGCRPRRSSARRNSCPISSASARVITSAGASATELGDLGAGREDPVAAGDDDRARRVVAQALGRRRPAGASSCRRQRVHLRVVEADDGDAVVAPLDVHEGPRHGRGRYRSSRPARSCSAAVHGSSVAASDRGRQRRRGRRPPAAWARSCEAAPATMRDAARRCTRARPPRLELARGRSRWRAVLARSPPTARRRPSPVAAVVATIGRPPAVGRGEVEHALEVAAGLVGAGAVGLVDDEDVGDLEQAGLVGLHGVAPAGVHHDDGGVGRAGHLDLDLADADGLDRAPTASRRRRGRGPPRGVASDRPPRWPRVAIERMNTPSSMAWSCMRTRSPRMAPPENGDDGSMASTADRRRRRPGCTREQRVGERRLARARARR